MFEWITNNVEGIISIVAQVVGVFAVIAVWTPNSSDNKVADALLEAVNFLGANLGKAKNDPNV
jgi:hypothetical protein|tara:strand:+ start:11200 stop:11388 length:189 start_codon:yes stop_codon:yes gene_type:complete